MAILTIECWLVISKSRKYGEVSARLAKQSPKLAPGEIPIKLKMNVPDTLFKQPQFVAQIEIPDPSPISPDVKITDTLRALADSVEQNIGIKISFEKPDPEQ